MKITAQLESSPGQSRIELTTGKHTHSIQIPPRAQGSGLSANGGELLFLALAACFCNDLYREAARRGIDIARVEVEVTGEFGAEGEPARNITYGVAIRANAPDDALRALVAHTDRVAEVHNTLRAGIAVTLGRVGTVPA